ncbi:phage minor head protein [Streptomyces sp. G1]|uniref:phage minor head protein n=1 Tax=Streptomyces sp. G1 TaxID=361572 RepID=UPI00202EB8EE|nr:phage minor head protein [Streptomyces sp. G1]MCM1964845.1 phage minor head protein [Streptomyces sp. G1]
MADIARALDSAERAMQAAVTEALDATAAEFSRGMRTADALTAATFSVSRIAAMWSRHVPPLVRRLLRIAEAATDETELRAEAPLPDDWDNLSRQYEDDRSTLPPAIGDYVTTTEHLLRAVGSRLAEAARAELAEGLNAGEDTRQLKARLRAVFHQDGPQLGPSRAALIAQTETTRAWNTGTLAAAQALTGPDRPLVKQWLTRRDDDVRQSHRNVNGQLRFLDESFMVGNVPMTAPGDPTAPASEVCNCRCYLAVARANRTTAALNPTPGNESEGVQRPGVFESQEATPMDPTDTTAVTAAADGSHLQGAMIALMPTAADAERLTVEGGEATEQLHTTLWFLGDNGEDWTPERRQELIDAVRSSTADLTGPVTARAFGANLWNGGGDSPCWVYAVSDDRDRPEDAPGLEDVHRAVTSALEGGHDRPEIPAQYTPWAPHMTAVYSGSVGYAVQLTERLGPVSFDRIRVTFAGDATDIPLGPVQEAPMNEETAAAGLTVRRWSTPGDTGLAYENLETGDGRIFAAGSLYWEAGPWPLQYADEMLMGHEGAELAGAIQSMDRDGDRITGGGVLYTSRPAGYDAVLLLEEDAPLGVSVDLDGVAVEFVDRTGQMTDGEAPVAIASAEVQHASLLRLPDGAWMVRVSGGGQWTASAGGLTRTAHSAVVVTGPGGELTRGQLDAAFPSLRTLTADAGDPDDPSRGTVVHSESTGDVLLRVTRGRVRGATLVAMPAYNRARIVLDPEAEEQSEPEPGDEDGYELAASAVGDLDLPVHDNPDHAWDGDEAKARILERATAADGTVDPDKLAAGYLYRDDEADPATASAYKLPFADVFEGELHIVPAGVYAIAGVLQGSMGGVDLPPEDRDAIKGRVETLYARIAKATDDPTLRPPWDDEDGEEMTAACSDPHDQVITFVRTSPVAVGAREVSLRLSMSMQTAQGHLNQATKAGRIVCLGRGQYVGPSAIPEGVEVTAATPGPEAWAEPVMTELEASAWSAIREAPPMPAAWFREPTAQELPPGSGGVHYAAGRIYGWVAQRGVPHAGHPGRNLTIESLGDIDFSHFLRARFTLDDGSIVRAGAFTMDVGHHRDGAECETEQCQFDNTRTVAGVVTVGMNAGGLWFSGAAAPHLADWTRTVFLACQPSYHMRQGPAGRWELRAVLSVPMPGHSSPLVAAVVGQANLALTASAAPAPGEPDPAPAAGDQDTGPFDLTEDGIDTLIAALLDRPGFIGRLLAGVDSRNAERARVREEVNALAATIRPAAAAAAGSTPEGS